MTQDYHKKLFTQASFNGVVLTGILTFLMHPFVLFGYQFPDLGILAWVHLVPLTLAIHRRKLVHKIILCFLSGMLGLYGILYWLMTAMLRYGGLNFFQAFAALTLALALLASVFTLLMATASWVNHLVKLPFFVLLPIFLTTRDLIMHNFPFNGLPWGIPPYSQGSWLSYFQWLDVTGPFGLSFFIYLINGLLADGFLLLVFRKQLDKMVSRLLVAFVLLLLSLFASFLSSQRYERDKVSEKSVDVGLIQANIPQEMKWEKSEASHNLDKHLRLTNTAVKDGARIIFWPETAFPYGLYSPKYVGESFLNKEKLSAPILFGAVVAEFNDNEGEMTIFNSVVHADEQAHLHPAYRKLHLVPFGEYLPLEKYLSQFRELTQWVGQFTPGSEFLLFNVQGLQWASLICFEDVFPQYARLFAKMSGDVLVNYTNDAWYGHSSMHRQHTVFSQFRALENRRHVLRVTNNGLTAVINPKGEITQSLPQYEEGYLVTGLKADRGYALYTEIGDGWVFAVATLAALILLYTLVKVVLGPVKKEF